jgi:hypothetical protein
VVRVPDHQVFRLTLDGVVATHRRCRTRPARFSVQGSGVRFEEVGDRFRIAIKFRRRGAAKGKRIAAGPLDGRPVP